MSVPLFQEIPAHPDSISSRRRVLTEMVCGALYLLASYLLLRVLHALDRAPFAGPEDPQSILFVFGVMALLRLTAWQSGLRGKLGVALPVLFVWALPFTFLQRTDRHDFGEWFALLLVAYLARVRVRWLMGSAVCVSALATPMAIWMPLVCLPMFIEQIGWRPATVLAAVMMGLAWSAAILADSHGAGQGLLADLHLLADSWRKGWAMLQNWQGGDLRRLRRLVPTGANLLNMLVLVLLLERFVLGAPRTYLWCLAIALGCCLFLSILNRQTPAHLLALIISPLFICLAEGVRRVPPLLHKPPVTIFADEPPMMRG